MLEYSRPTSSGDVVLPKLTLFSSSTSSGIDCQTIILVSPHTLQVRPSETVTPFGQDMMATVGQQSSHSTALVGLRVEPLEQLAQETPASGTQASSLSNMSEFSQKMLENLFNFASSYAVDPTQSALTPGETYIPAAALRQWYSNFQRRFSANPNFWKTL